MISEKKLRRSEIAQIWNIDRSEVIDNLYSLENGTLLVHPHHIALARKLSTGANWEDWDCLLSQRQRAGKKWTLPR
jgi:hypothetical protein